MGMFEMSADQVAEWRQKCLDPGLKIGSEQSGSMTALTIESPADGQKATLVGISVKDDPVSQELIGVLTASTATGA